MPELSHRGSVAADGVEIRINGDATDAYSFGDVLDCLAQMEGATLVKHPNGGLFFDPTEGVKGATKLGLRKGNEPIESVRERPESDSANDRSLPLDGKAVAAAITAAYGTAEDAPDDEFPRVNLQEMVIRRSRREYRTPVTYTPLDQRDNFDVTTLTYTAEEAKTEAARCLDCHEICSLCVGVCPNMALMTYEMDPVRYQVPVLAVENGIVEARDPKTYAVDQPFQIAVLADFCNECGNCETACPTSGKPYVDKPRLYLNRADFLAEDNNAFMMFGDSVMEARIGGETHRMSVNSTVAYETPSLTATLNPVTLAVESAQATGASESAIVSLKGAAAMFTLLSGLQESMQHLPVFAGDLDAYSTIAHPGYVD